MKITLKEFTEKALDFNNHHDFSGGVNVSDREFKRWIKDGIDNTIKKIKEKNLEESFSSISSGNGKVFIEVYVDNDKKYTIYVSFTRGYSTYSNYNIIL